MKNKICFLLSLAIVTACISPLTAFAINETTGSTDVSFKFPQTTTSPDTGGGDSTDTGPSYSYIVDIPASFALTNSSNSFQITANSMDIPTDKEVVVRINSAETFESDGNFYLFLNGDKTSEDWILCNIYRIQGNLTSYVMGENPVIASFSPGALLPNNCDSIRLEHILYYDGADLEAGTYTGTIYYTIGLE